jgi:hypothetical protein
MALALLNSIIDMLPRDLEDIILAFACTRKPYLADIPYAWSRWWWQRGIIRSPAGGWYSLLHKNADNGLDTGAAYITTIPC